MGLCTMIGTFVSGPIMLAQAKPILKHAIKRQEFRNEFTKFEAIVDSLNIAPGMTILDIGSGPGYASFLFAEKLQGTGAVFATDIRKDFVDHIATEAKRRGLTNLFSSVVKEQGVDDYYLKNRYDLVFLSNVYHCIDNRIEYFTTLRGLLKRDARLVLIFYNQVPLFSVDDLSDAEELIKSLTMEAGDNPFFKHLSTGTKQLLKDRINSEAVETALIDDFNRMLTDPQFYKNFYKNSFFKKDYFTAPERDYANWLLMSLREDGVLDRPVAQIDAKAMRTVIKLNRLFFIKRFGDFLENDGSGAYIPAGDANRQTSKYVMFRELDSAGYKFIKEIKVSTYFDAVIMVPKTP